jgi:hypothetical protein
VVSFAPSSTTTYAGTITVSGDQTSGANTLAISGTGTGTTQPVSLSTLTGTVTDATSRGVLPGVTVEVASGPNDGQGVLTDANGKYTLSSLSAGTFNVSAGATSYLTTTSPVTVGSNTQLNFVLQRTTSLPASTTRTRIGATCTDGWTSTATGSGACSSHGGVRCWRYTDGSCTNP